MTRTIKVIFTLSLLCNVLLVGVVGGHIYHRVQSSPWKEGRAQLSEEARALMRQSFHQNKAQHREDKRAMRDKIEQMRDVLSAQDFDVTAYDALSSGMIALRAQHMDRKMQSLKNVAITLQPEERATLSHMITKQFDVKKHKKRKGRRDTQ